MHVFTLQDLFKKIQGGLMLALLLFLTVQIANAQSHNLVIDAPATIAGEYELLAAGFGPAACEIDDVTAAASFVVDGMGGTTACDTVTNDLTGKIAFIDRGGCNFSLKAYYAQVQGAVGVIVCNNVPDAIIAMASGDFGDQITIPALMLSQQQCNQIRAEVEGTTVTIDRTDPIDMSGEVVIWHEEFDGGLNGWTSNSISCGAPNDTFMLWQWTEFGATSGSSCGDNSILSPSYCNGAVAFASDAYDNNPGNDCGQGGGPCPAPQVGELISPPIDLSSSTAAGVSVRFYQIARQFQSTFFVGYSIDGGITWDSTEINQELVVNEQGVTTSVVKMPLPGAVGQSDVRLKFRYEANYYYWLIDDVQIVEQEANNLRVNANWFATPPNAITPISQVEPIPFLADIENVGASDQTNVILNMTITDQDDNEVFNVDNEYNDVAANTLVENIPFIDTYTPESEGQYHGTYTISADATDDDPTNNTQEFDFIVSDTVFAKELGTTRTLVSAAGNYDEGAPFSVAIGNYFFVPNGTNHFVRSVSFAIQGTEESAGLELAIVLYKWNDTDPEADVPAAEPEEREFVEFTSYLIQGDEDENNIITLPFPMVELEDNGNYILMLEYQATEQVNVTFATSDIIDYRPSNFTSNLLGAPRFGAMTGVPSDGDLSVEPYGAQGFGFNLVPVVRMNVVTPTDANDIQVLKNEFKLFPNPTSDQISVQMNLEELAQTATIRILDIAGRQVMQQTYDNIQKERLTFDVKTLTAGTYMVQVVTERGAGTKRFIVK